MIGHNFILEGIDGTGKTTIAHRLDEELNDRIKTALMTSSPFDLPIGKTLKSILIDPCNDLDWVTETCLFCAMFRQHHLAFTNHIKAGMVNICDRGYRSLYAYQGANGANLYDISRILYNVYDADFHNNTDIIILDTNNISNGLGRTEMDRFTYKGEEYYTKVRDIYRTYAVSSTIHFVNADRLLDDVYYDVKEIVVDILREKHLLND